MLKLLIHVGEDGGTCGFSLNQETISIGRRFDNDLRVKLGSVSAYHAKLECHRNGDLFLTDCDSLNGTFCNGDRVEGRIQISKTDTLSFGCLVCTIESFQPELLPDGAIEEKLLEKLAVTRQGFSNVLHQQAGRTDVLNDQLCRAEGDLREANSEIEFLKNELVKAQVEYAAKESKYLEHLTKLVPTKEGAETQRGFAVSISPNDEHLKLLKETIEQLRTDKLSLLDENNHLKTGKDLENIDDSLTGQLLDRQKGIFSRKSLFPLDEETGEPDQEFFVELVGWLEMFDDLMAFYDRKLLFPKLSSQLKILKDSFIRLLNQCSIDQFTIEPGEQLTVESRNKIQLIHVDDLEDSKIKKAAQKLDCDDGGTKVVQTLRSGYIYRKSGKDVVIRKADVVIA